MSTAVTSNMTKYKMKNHSAFFMKPKGVSLKTKLLAPGPGSYQIHKNPSAKELIAKPQASVSVFKSTTEKSLGNNIPKDRLLNPAPGQYEFERDNLLKNTLETYNVEKSTSAFRNPLHCKRVKVNLYDPFQKVEPTHKVPGPGTYSLEKETLAYRCLEKMTTGMLSSMFQQTNSEQAAVNGDLDLKNTAVGDLTEGFSTKHGGILANIKTSMKIPGPGAYEVEPVWRSDDQGGRFDSMMRSDTVRDFKPT